MNIIVLVKQIPDPAVPVEPATGTPWLVKPDYPIIDETDRYGIEIGLQLAAGGGTVTLLSMGCTQSVDGIRQGLAMGADRALYVDDDPEHGSDVLTTARALAAVIAREGYDLVVTGTASTDGSSGVLCQMLGEILNVPSITNVTEIDTSGDGVTVHRQTPGGYDVVGFSLPAVISVTAGVVDPRYPTLQGTMNSKRKQIPHEALADIDASLVGVASAPAIVSIRTLPKREAGRKIEDKGEAYQEIVSLLAAQGVI